MCDIIQFVTKYKTFIELTFTLAMIVLTIASVLVALFSYRTQAKSLLFVRWATLRPIAADLFLHEKNLRESILREPENDANSILAEEAERIRDARTAVESTIEDLERLLNMLK